MGHPKRDPKSDALREQGTLNPRPERVTDELFRQSEFFDRKDLPQVKYEMLRRVQKEGVAIARAAEAFGFSRPSFYQAQAAFTAAGLSGLLPKKRGPRGAHKLNAEVMRFIEDVETGMVHVNEPTIGGEAQLPFGGTKATGVGEREMAEEGLNFFTELKTVFVNFSGKAERHLIR